MIGVNHIRDFRSGFSLTQTLVRLDYQLLFAKGAGVSLASSGRSVSQGAARKTAREKIKKARRQVASHADVLRLVTRDKPKNVRVGG